jgi:hypothetical protein
MNEVEELHCGCDDYPSADCVDSLKQENQLLREQLEKLQKTQLDSSRKYLPTLGELLDRLTITQIKEVKIAEHKDKYAQEIKEILHDIDLLLSTNEIWFNGQMLRALVVLAQMNLHIWHNESNFRRGIKDGNNLELTHGLNGIRNTAKNMIQDVIGGRKDYKIDCVAAEFKDWEVSW